MSNLSLSASVIALVLGATACLDQTQGPFEKNSGVLHDGSVSGSFSEGLVKRDNVEYVNLVARDVGGDGTVINSSTYTRLDHDFRLELPGGKYKLDFTDPSGNVLATYNNFVVDGDMKLAPTNKPAE